MKSLSIIVVAAMLAGCPKSQPRVHCTMDSDCVRGSVTGICVPNENACAFADPSCPSGYRYDTTAANGAGDCVMFPSGTDLSMPPDMAVANVIDMAAAPDMTMLPPDMSTQSTDMAGTPSTWVKLGNSTLTSIYGVFTTPGRVFLAGQNGNTPALMVSTNNGGVWSSTYFTPAPGSSFRAVWGTGTDVWTGGGASAEVYHATDGMNFNKQTSAFSSGDFESFAGSATDLWAAGTAGLMHSTNSGSTWTSANSTTFGYDAIHGVARNTADIYAIGYFTASHVYSSTDGTTWTPTTLTQNPYGIYSTPDGAHIYIVGTAGMIMHSKNNGAFASETSPVNTTFNAVWSTSTGEAFAVGSTYVIHTDGSGTWTQMTIPSVAGDNLTAVWGTSGSDVWVGGAAGAVLHYH